MKERTYFVIFKCPRADTESQLLASYHDRIEKICSEYCFKIGTLYILPKTYFVTVKDLLHKMEIEYNKIAYGPFFKVIGFSLCSDDYKELLKTASEYFQLKLENYLRVLEEKDGLAPLVFKEIVKVKEFIQIFQLERFCPRETAKLQDLVSILNEKTLDQKVGVGQVEVLEL